jgi:hypothetical protein
MQVILNEQGFVDSYALIGGFESPSLVVDEPEDIEDFQVNYRSYYLSDDNMLIKSNEKQAELENNKVLSNLRSQREKICFPYINRGDLWYNRLSDVQIAELNIWYQAWLDVTETKIIPEAPEWLINF